MHVSSRQWYSINPRSCVGKHLYKPEAELRRYLIVILFLLYYIIYQLGVKQTTVHPRDVKMAKQSKYLQLRYHDILQ